jgi:flagellar hook-associated protein 2
LAISSSGIGSGLDINGLIAQIVKLERQPLVLLDQSEAKIQAKLSAYGILKGSLSAFESAMGDLASITKFRAVGASVSDATVFTAVAAAGASPGTHSIEVKQLAQAQKLVSKEFAGSTTVLGSGTLTLQFGSYSGGVFTPNADEPAQTLSISAASGTVAGIRDAINAAGIGVVASLLNSEGSVRLVLTPAESGAKNSLKITVSGDTDGNNLDDAGLSSLAFDPVASAGNGKNLSETANARDALLKVDGIDNIVSAGNTVSKIIDGVTLTLLKPSAAGVPADLTLSVNAGSIKSAVKSFAKAYNDLAATVSSVTAYDPVAKRASVLQGDSSALGIRARIRTVLASNQAVTGAPFSTLSDIGVSFQRDGTLQVNEARLQSAIERDVEGIGALFANLGRPTDSLIKYVSASSRTQPGNYAVEVTRLATQGFVQGQPSPALADAGISGTFDSPFVIDVNNDTVALKVNGIQTGAVSLAPGSYQTAGALTAEIQSKINGAAGLLQAGVGVSVSFDSVTDRLRVTSSSFGSVSAVEITQVDTQTASSLGLAVGTGTTGLDAAGTIGGVTASGIGQRLSAATGSSAEGLQIDVLGGAEGARGQIGYTQGLAHRLERLARELLGEAGPIASRSDGLNASIAIIDERREQLERRLVDTERRLRVQFTALDGLVGKLRSTSDFLSQQLANIARIGRDSGSG